MRDLNIAPELEIYDTGHLDACLRLRDKAVLLERLQFSIVLGVQGGMAATADNLLSMVRRLPEGSTWQVIAIGRANLELTAICLALGGNARAGLEDTLYLRKGQLAEGSTPLVERIVQLVTQLDRDVATAQDTAQSWALGDDRPEITVPTEPHRRMVASNLRRPCRGRCDPLSAVLGHTVTSGADASILDNTPSSDTVDSGRAISVFARARRPSKHLAVEQLPDRV